MNRILILKPKGVTIHCKSGKPYLPCQAGLADCFAMNSHGCCIALQDTDFHGGACTFYKTSEQEGKDRAASVERLKRIGREDLIEKYRLGPRKAAQEA